ncbi:MAG: prepilin-type N-terminal cleavage/methylation domain-containing protein [Gammaproteobacteria bacterium]|nr:prepilin-type N-terminal cleavage/methylation domain-containing protein [Gammaproteobacteria bacterium]
MKNNHGFTLVEVLIVAAIIGIIAAFAIPSYTSYVERSKRADCMGALSNATGAMERFKAANMTYVGADLNTPFVEDVPSDGGNPYCQISVDNLSQTTYTLTATMVNSMAGQDALSIDQAGNKTWGAKACWPEGGASC